MYDCSSRNVDRQRSKANPLPEKLNGVAVTTLGERREQAYAMLEGFMQHSAIKGPSAPAWPCAHYWTEGA
jgi:hypothetical protein